MIPAGPVELTALPRPFGTGMAMPWHVPGSKSMTNRALVLAALAPGETELHRALECDDSRHMRDCLRDLGFHIDVVRSDIWKIHGGLAQAHQSADNLWVGNSGTTVRFLAACCALIPGAHTLVGDEHMARRPIADLVDALRTLGVEVDCPSGCPPLSVYGGGFASNEVAIRGDSSSQYLSALMMAGAANPDGLTIRIDGPLVSRPYVEMTAKMMARFGAEVDWRGDRIAIPPQTYTPIFYATEPDCSSASYAFAAAAATRSSVYVPVLGQDDVIQGDIAFLDVLAAMGCEVRREGGSVTVTGPKRLRGGDFDLHHISDTAPTLAALAPLCDAPVRIRNVANIRLKETDRLAALAAELRRLGQEVTETEDSLTIVPKQVRPATVECYADHRIAMSFAVLGLARDGVTIADPGCVAKTYPDFWQDLGKCYRNVRLLEPWKR